MYRAMLKVLLGGGLLSAGGWTVGLLSICLVVGCDMDGGVEPTETGSAEGTTVTGCTPACDGETCGDDSCGGRCACRSGFECDDDGICMEQPACIPQCDGSRCDDGCGGECRCAEGLVCNAGHECVRPVECVETCSEAHYECGNICGVDCGSCGQDETCSLGKCKSSWSSLMLRLEEAHKVSGRIEARLAVEFDPADGQALPRMADLRLALEGAADLQIEAVSLGSALEKAGKTLFTDALTGKPWQVLPDGAVQLLVYSSQNVTEVGAGRWLTIVVSMRDVSDAKLHLVRSQGLFAPLSADSAVQESAYDLPITVTP